MTGCAESKALAGHVTDQLTTPTCRPEPAHEHCPACGGLELRVRACQRTHRAWPHPPQGVDHEFQLGMPLHARLCQGSRVAYRRLLEKLHGVVDFQCVSKR